MAHTVVFSCCSTALPHRLTSATSVASISSPCNGNTLHQRSLRLRSSGHLSGQWLEGSTCISRNQPSKIRLRVSVKAQPDVEVVHDEEWERLMRQQSAEREREKEKDQDDEVSKESAYRNIAEQLQDFPPEELKQARKFVASLIKAGEEIEEMIEKAADNDELTPLILLVIKNRLDLARHDDERDAMQALDLLYRRVETEMLSRKSSPAYQLLNELLNLHDGFSREEWLQRSRRIMLQVFPPEDAFSILSGPAFDLNNHHGPIGMPEEEDDILLRIDFIREVDAFLSELNAQPAIEPMQGFDPASIAIRLRQEERLRAIEQVKDLRNLAVKLQW